MTMSASSKDAVISKGLKQYSERSRFFENSRIHWDLQNKHIPGKHNYKNGVSIFEHKSPDSLLKVHAGTGIPKNSKMGQAGYKEIVDFKEHIGFWKNKMGDSLPTTKGNIHYRKDGQAHIVPAHPHSKIW